MKNNRKIGLFILVLSLILSLAACTAEGGKGQEPANDLVGQEIEQAKEDGGKEIKSNFPVEIEDNFGNKLIMEEEPTKIISLDPSNTETLFALGLGDKLLGVSSNCNYPEEATTKEVVGSYDGMNLERIVELDPDIVLIYGAGNEEENKILADAGIKVLGFMPESIASVTDSIETIANATGRQEEAQELIKEMMAKKESIQDAVKGQEDVKVFYEIWHDPLMGAGKGSFMDELITVSGGMNIAQDADGAYPQYDLEQLIERDTDVYMASQAMEDITVESIKQRPGYDVISAIKNDRVYLFIGPEADMVSRPGPRIIDALEIVAKAIQPQAFK